MASGASDTPNTNSCPYCGNNPVPHFINWYFESVNILLTPLRQFLLYNPLSRFLKRLSRKQGWGLLAVRFFHKLGVISFQDDMSRCKVSRAVVLWEEAKKRGIEMKELLLFGRPFDAYIAQQSRIPNSKYQMSNGAQGFESKILNSARGGSASGGLKSSIYFSGLPRPKDYDGRMLDLMDDKAVLKKKLLTAGLPMPQGGSVWTWRQALKIFRRIEKPVIVKPRAGSRGRHSTTYIYTEADLKRAYRAAKQLCFWVMVEEMLEGPVYRATLIGGKLRGVLRGDAPQVTGDGAHTIAELIKIKNQAPHPGVKDIVFDEKMDQFLRREFSISNFQFSNSPLEYVPNENQSVVLSEKIGVNYGGSSSEDLDICHPETKAMFERAAAAVGDPIVGFDFIIPDITKSYKEQRCGFLEANSLPFINLHHDPLLGTPQNVAGYVWELAGM